MSDINPASGRIQRGRRRRVLPLLLAFFVAASLVEGGVLIGRATSGASGGATTPIASVLGSTATTRTSGLSAVIARAMRSVVSVRTVSTQPSFFGARQVQAQGSGVIVGKNLVVTNAHVVEGARKVTVSFGTGGQSTTATVLGTDTTHDLAVLSVPTGDHPAITIGSSSNLALGQQVVALGYPLGLGATATAGIVSGLDRTIDVSSTTGGTEHLVGLLQTDAAINPGNSGGPLINAGGQLVGINTAGASASSAENIGFAIAIDGALPIIQNLAGARV